MVRDESLTIRFSLLEMAEIERIAKDEERTKGAVVRLLVNEALIVRRAEEAKR